MQDLLVEEGERRVTVTFNRPEKRNALTHQMLDDFTQVLRRAHSDRDLRVLVLRGGGGYFSAGIDLSDAMAFNKANSPVRAMRNVAELVVALFRLPLPTIAVVEGGAYGLAANLALACDLTVAADDAVFSQVFIRRGLSVDGGGAWLLPRLVGLKRAKELLFFGDELPATLAAELGLINHAVPASELDSFVDGWVSRLRSCPPLPVALAKSLLNEAVVSGFEETVEKEGLAQTVVVRSDDSKEAYLAAREGRLPEFAGR